MRVEYTYDTNGNLTKRGTSYYSWNYTNQMTGAGNGSATTTYGYDHTGQRVFKVTPSSATTAYANDYYDTDGTTKTKHIYAGGELVATITTVGATSTTQYLHTDHLGSVTAASNASGSVVEATDFYPYGSERYASGSFEEQRKYIGQEYDTESSLSYLNARYYEGSRGQFLSQDPVFWEIGQTQDGKAVLANPQAQNSYSYANGNPITSKDPTGRVVYLYSRPVDMPWGTVGAHTFVQVVPDNPDTVGSVPDVDTSKSFTLSGFPNNGRLQKYANAGADPSFTSCGTSCGTSRVTVVPPNGMTSEQFDANVVSSYNNIPSDLGKYWFWGSPKVLGRPNSNNFTTTLLTNAGVSQDSLLQYQNSLSQGNNKLTPGFGTPALTSTYLSQLKSQLKTLKNQLRAVARRLKNG